MITNDVRSQVTIGKRFKPLFIVAVLFIISCVIFNSAASGRPTSDVLKPDADAFS